MRFHQPRLGDAFEFSVASAAPLELSDFGSATASDLLFAAAATGAFSPSPELEGVAGSNVSPALASTEEASLLPSAV